MEKTVAVGFLFVIGFNKVFVSGQYCSNAAEHNESPAINMCMDNNISVDSNTWVYLDSTGAPNFQTVSCSCELDFQYTGTLNIRYRSEGEQSCGIEFRLDDHFWSCERSKSDTFVTQSGNNITYYKIRDDIMDAPACLGLKPGVGTLDITCFPSQHYTLPTTTVSGASTSTSTTTTVTTPVTTSPDATTSVKTPPVTRQNTTDTVTSSTGQSGTGTTDSSTAESETTGDGSTFTTPKVAEAVEDNTAAIAGGVVGACVGLILLILLVIFLICFTRRRKEKKKEEIVFGPRTVRYNSATSGDDVQITENALYDGENPSVAMNQLFIGGIPPTPGAQDSELPRFETTEEKPRYAEVGASNATKPKVNEELDKASFRKGSTNSDEVELKLDNDYSVIDTGISNPGYEPGYKAPYTMPYDNKLGVGTGIPEENKRPTSASPYDYIDNEKLKQDEEVQSLKGEYVRIRDEPDAQTDRDTDAGGRLGSESSAGGRTGSESGPDRGIEHTGSESGPDKGIGQDDGSSTGYANDINNGYLAAAHMGYDQV